MNKELWEKIKPLVLKMRKKSTECESTLWNELKKSKLGVKFRRQHPIERFIVDFFSLELQLAIEVDGEIHNNRLAYDNERDEYLKSLGIKTLRFTNNQIKSSMESVINQIKTQISILQANLR